MKIVLTDNDFWQLMQMGLQLGKMFAQLRFPALVKPMETYRGDLLGLVTHLHQKLFHSAVYKSYLTAGIFQLLH